MSAAALPEVRVSAPVASALADGEAVVALESTVFSNLGLPAPANSEALDRCLAAVTEGGAVPAITAVIDGVPRVGLDPSEHSLILTADRKTASRELPVAMAQRWPVGVTTVSASMALAAAAGVKVFATGGIGGAHRGSGESGDISADLPALGSYPVLCVSAGAKAFLDLGRTLETLETLAVPVLGYQTDDFPAFYLRTSGLPAPQRVETADEAARVLLAGPTVGYHGGVLVVAQIPEADALDADEIWAVIDDAQAAADEAGLAGAKVTPFILERIAQITDGRSVPANLSLAENNARVAAAIAVAVANHDNRST